VTAVVFLSQTEADLVFQGRLEEPGFRPHPRSRDYDEPDEYEYEYDGDNDLAPSESGEIVDSFEHIARALHWKRYTYERALLASPSRPDVGGALLGIAVAAGGPRIGRRGVRRVAVGPWRAFSEPVPLTDISSDLASAAAGTFARILAEGHSRPLPPGLSAAMNDVLRRRVPNYELLSASLPNRPVPKIPVGVHLANLDANLTALRLFTRSWHSLTPVAAPAVSDFAIQIELATQGNENDYITDDTAEFLGWNRSNISRQGWWEFRKGDMRLHLKNINVSNAENHTGADLVYVRREPETVVFVQYKLLSRLEQSGEPIFRPDRRLESQIDRMLSFSPTFTDRGPDEVEARLGGDFAFVKFILPTNAPMSTQERAEGRYLPADAVRRMLMNPDRGPKGGQLHYVYRRRHIDGETFARLVRDRWIGSIGGVTELLMQILGIQPSEHRAPLTLAVEERLPGSAV
jgi:hypothetical protein